MDNNFQAIVIGAGMSGSWVAKELCDAGVKTLLLDRGPEVVHVRDYPTTTLNPWEFERGGKVTAAEKAANPILSRCYAYGEESEHFFVKDAEQPYVQEKPFDWIKGYQVGGKSLMWARQTQRWSEFDFAGPKRDGFAVDWPIRYSDIKEWYDKVETFVGISGEMDGLDALPDGIFLKSLGLNCVDYHLKEVLKENYDNRHYIYARCAHLTDPQEIHLKQGRGKCQNRLLCVRGCPYGAYFSANSSTIPWAKKTGNLTLVPNSVVHSILYDEQTGKASGVKVIDANTKEETVYSGAYIFVNAGAINTNAILLNSKSDRFPDGLGNDNKLLGKYFAFHNYRSRVTAVCPDFSDKVEEGKSPSNGYIPRFRNLYKQDQKFKRGYAVAMYCSRSFDVDSKGVGEGLVKEFLKEKNFGPWEVYALMMGETIPLESNQISLHPTEVDKYGIPLVNFNIDYSENELLMMEDFYEQMEDLFEKAGFTEIKRIDTKQAPGLDIHEMGGVRMGHDPETSLLDKWGQLHTCKNVIVSDGACMTSTATQNPSLTYMALAARAANHVIDAMKSNGEIES